MDFLTNNLGSLVQLIAFLAGILVVLVEILVVMMLFWAAVSMLVTIISHLSGTK